MNFSGLREYVNLSEKQEKQFSDFYHILQDFNTKMNLTALKDPLEIYYKHFVDSILYGQIALKEDSKKIVDLGTGAGFPGIPLSILYPDKYFCLVDALNKRINFLNHVIETLDLDNVETYHSRGETIGQLEDYRETFDLGLARSVAYLPILAEYLLPLVKVGGFVAVTKELPLDNETEASLKALEILGGKLVDLKTYELPHFKNKRGVVIIEKVATTPTKYPRRPGIPTKKPL